MCLFVQYKCPNNAGVGLSIPHFDSLVGEGQKGREREGNRSIPVFFPLTLSPGSHYGLVLVVPGGFGYVRGRRVVLDSHRQLSVVN